MLHECLEGEALELIKIGSDIEDNMEAVEEVEEPIFLQIMRNYRNKVAASQEYGNLQAPVPALPSLVFPHHPLPVTALAQNINLTASDPGPVPPSLHCSHHVQSLEEGEASFAHEQPPAPLNRALFPALHPLEMPLHESLSLTEIRESEEQNESQPYLRQGESGGGEVGLAMSGGSLGYYLADTLKYSLREETEQAHDTETLLIC